MAIPMTKSNWRDIAELIGIAAIVASLIFLALQIRQQQLVADTEARNSTVAQLAEVSQLMNENRDIWIRGLKGEELTQIEGSIFHTLAFTEFRRQAATYSRGLRLSIGNPDRQAQAFAFELYAYPGLRRWFDQLYAEIYEERTFFGQETDNEGWTLAVKEALAEIDRRSPPIPESKKTYSIP